MPPANGSADRCAIGNNQLTALRQIIANVEHPPLAVMQEHLPFGLTEVDGHLPGNGLACGALHEITAQAHGDKPAAFGFAVALMALALCSRPGPAILVAARRSFKTFGAPYGHGLCQLGFDVERLVLIESASNKDTLWAIEETLRSGAAPALVLGAVEGVINLAKSRRLSLAAAAFGTPLILMRTSETNAASAAVTRWRIGSASRSHDRFGAFSCPRWNVALERCRNGRAGQWVLEWDHVAHRFRMAEIVANRSSGIGAGETSLRLAG